MVRSMTNSAPILTKPVPSQIAKPKPSIPPPCIPLQQDYYKRTQSFKNWPRGTGVKVSDLVNSGFTYLGIGDQVQCFYCGEVFNNWRETDVVDNEHIRLSPNCVFIRQKLGHDNGISTGQEHQAVQRQFTNGMSKMIPHNEPLPARSLPYSHCVDPNLQQPPNNLHPVAPRDIRARLDTAHSRKLIDMGFKKPLLAQVIGERLAEVGDDFPTFMEYFIAVKNAEQILSGGAVDTLKSFYDEKVKRLSDPASLNKSETETTPPDDPTETQTQPTAGAASNSSSNGRRESSSLKRKKECAICMDNEADTVFMPCRHMCSCSECADKLTNCPICRKGIEHCIKVFV